MAITHFIEWTIGPDETDVCIEFSMLNASQPGYFNPVTGDGCGPVGAELEMVSAHTVKTEEDIKEGHPLWAALNEAWDNNDDLYNKAADMAEDYDPTEDWV